MKKGWLFLLLWGVSVLHAQVPDFELEDLDGRLTTYEEVRGEHLTLIDFWATWCVPCVRSIPAFKSFHEEFKDRGFAVIGVNVDGPRNLSKVKPFVQSYGIEYPILIDVNLEVSSELGVTGYPALFLVDADGRILHSHTGFQPGDEDVIRQHILEYLPAEGETP